MTSTTTHTINAPGAQITYDVHGTLAEGAPLLLIGSPMDAEGFTTLAAHFTDRPVITYDPRGTGRSRRTDGHGELIPDQHAADLRLVVEALGSGPVDVFASSGGAVNALAWVGSGTEQVRTLVAHEPPISTLLPDREALSAVVEDIHQTYHRDGMGQAMAKFIALISHDGPLPDGFELPVTDPAQFGLPADDDGTRDDPVVGQNLRGCTSYELDVPALRAAGTRILPAHGEGDQMPARGARAVAEVLGVEPTVFPGDHGGFLGGEYGMHGEPDAFAARLREVLPG